MVLEEATKRTVVVESTAAAMAEPRQWLLSQLEGHGYAQDDVFAVHLALEEAFYNAVKHGNRMDSTRQVKLEFVVGPEQVEVSMTDNGGGFDPNSVPDCRLGENLYKTEGRGILLMRSYMDVVEFNKTLKVMFICSLERKVESASFKVGKLKKILGNHCIGFRCRKTHLLIG